MVASLKFFSVVSAALILYLIIGCGYFKQEGDETHEPFYDSEHFLPGDSINALGYEAGKKIDIYISGHTKAADIHPISDGDFVTPGIPITVYIETTTRFLGKEPMDQRVYISDGGNSKSIEAHLDETSGFYVCQYTFDSRYLLYPLLIQVIYPDYQASKRKVLLRTQKNSLKPLSNTLVKNGLAITLGQHVLEGLKTQFQSLVPGTLKLTELKPSTEGDSVLYLELGSLIGANISINDTYIKEGEEVRGLSLDLDLTSSDQGYAQVMNWIVTLFKPAIDSAGLTNRVMGPLSFSLDDMISSLAKEKNETKEGEAEESAPAGLSFLEGLTLDSRLFINLLGVPDETDEAFAVVGAGLYTADSKTLMVDPETEKPMWPDVEVDDTDKGIDISRIKKSTTDLGIGISQYNLNQVLSDIMKRFTLVLGPDKISALKDYIKPQNADDTMTLAITVNPEGIAVDFTQPGLVSENTALMVLNDIHAEICENDIAKALLSLDITLKIDSSLNIKDENLTLDLDITPMEELCHIHLMKDNKEIGILDHATLVSKLFEEISGCQKGEPLKVSLSLTDLGIAPSKSKGAGEIEFDGKGNCFMNVAAESIDTSRFCFISSLY